MAELKEFPRDLLMVCWMDIRLVEPMVAYSVAAKAVDLGLQMAAMLAGLMVAMLVDELVEY